MQGSAAKIIDTEKKEIVMTRISRRNKLLPQKIAGLMMLAVIVFMVTVGGELSAAAVLAPMALAAVFSKEKIMDFGIFSEKTQSKS